MDGSGGHPRVDPATLSVSVPLHATPGLPERPVADSHRLLWSAAGAVCLEVDGCPSIIGRRSALWVPANQRLTRIGPGALIRATFDPDGWSGLPARPMLIALDDVLAANLTHFAELATGPVADAAIDVIAERLSRAMAGRHRQPPFPADSSARRVAEAVAADPADRRSLVAWAQAEATSVRTLRRRFVCETGLTFSQWSSAVRMQHARALLADGLAPSIVASRCGYRTSKALKQALRADEIDELDHSIARAGQLDESPVGRGGGAGRGEGVRIVRVVERHRRTRTFTDALGRTVSVPRHPTRIAALHDFTIGEPLLAIGATVVAMTGDRAERNWHAPIARRHDLDDVVMTGAGDAIDLATLRDLEPDLILAYAWHGATLPGVDIERLQQIAPTVAFDESQPRSAHLADLAALAGRSDELDRQRQIYAAAVSTLADRLPPTSRRRLYASLVVEDAVMCFHSRVNPNPIARALRNLDLPVSRLTDRTNLYVDLDDAGQLTALDEPDVLLIESRSNDPSTVQRWSELQAVADGRVFEVETPAGTSYRSGLGALDAIGSALLGLTDAA
ncbi:MAG: helix-turn-helix domain-containing protein [Actinomycetota bacterium]